MTKCPVCEYGFPNPAPTFCPQCGWDIKNDPTVVFSFDEMPDAELEEYEQRIKVAKTIWQERNTLMTHKKKLEQELAERQREYEQELGNLAKTEQKTRKKEAGAKQSLKNAKRRVSELEKRLKEEQNRATRAEHLVSQNKQMLDAAAQQKVRNPEFEKETIQETKSVSLWFKWTGDRKRKVNAYTKANSFTIAAITSIIVMSIVWLLYDKVSLLVNGLIRAPDSEPLFLVDVFLVYFSLVSLSILSLIIRYEFYRLSFGWPTLISEKVTLRRRNCYGNFVIFPLVFTGLFLVFVIALIFSLTLTNMIADMNSHPIINVISDISFHYIMNAIVDINFHYITKVATCIMVLFYNLCFMRTDAFFHLIKFNPRK